MSREQRREEIIARARRLFEADGYRGTTIRALARALGVNEALIYQHFSSKEALYKAAVIDPLLIGVKRTADLALEVPADPTARAQWELTEQFHEHLLQVLKENIILLGQVLFRDPKSGRRFYRKYLQPALQKADQAIERQWTSWPHRPFEPWFASRGAFGMAFWLVLDAELTDRPLDVEQTAKDIADVYFYGLAMGSPPQGDQRQRSDGRAGASRGRLT